MKYVHLAFRPQDYLSTINGKIRDAADWGDKLDFQAKSLFDALERALLDQQGMISSLAHLAFFEPQGGEKIVGGGDYNIVFYHAPSDVAHLNKLLHNSAFRAEVEKIFSAGGRKDFPGEVYNQLAGFYQKAADSGSIVLVDSYAD